MKRNYPCILDSGAYTWLAYDHENGIALNDNLKKYKGNISFDSDPLKDVTADYLRNTYGKVESKEHAEFIKLLAGNEGIKCNYMVVSDEIKYFYFSGGVLFFTFSSVDDDRFKLITIPLPPKESSMESQKEWPQVGDSALTDSKEIVEVVAIDNDMAWVKHSFCETKYGYLSMRIKMLSKPPTTEEGLESEVRKIIKKKHAELIGGPITSEMIGAMACNAAEMLMKHYDIKKKPQ